MKLLLPYERHPKFPTDYFRKSLTETSLYYSVWQVGGTWYHTNGPGKKFSSKREAQESLDEMLIKNGWRLLSKEAAEKLKLLL